MLGVDLNFALNLILALSSCQGVPKIPKADAVKVLHSICEQIQKTQQWPQDWKRLVFVPIPKKGNAKQCLNYHTVALISHASKVMLKNPPSQVSAVREQKTSKVQAGFRKGRGIRDQIANIQWITEIARECSKTSTSTSLTMPKLLTVWVTANCEKFFKIWEYQIT